MYIGLGVVLLIGGAILAFATSADVSGIDLRMVGWILMAGGFIAIVMSLALSRRRSIASHRVIQRDPATGTEIHDSRIDGE